MMPVLIVGYRRVMELNNLLNQMASTRVDRIYVAIDGHKDGQGEYLSREFKSLISNFGLEHPRIQISTWFREENLGSAISVISAITWAFQSEERLAILEDDLLISPTLLDYFDQNIELIDGSNEYLMLAGTNSFVFNASIGNMGWANYPIAWGWATTKKKWQEISHGILDQDYLFPERTPRKLRKFLESGRIRSHARKIDAWDVPLAAYMYATEKRAFIPPVNLVSNVGGGPNSTHTKKSEWPLNVPRNMNSSTFKLSESELMNNHFCYNELIEKKIFRLKSRHHFSRIKLALSQLFDSSPMDQNSLKNAVLKVQIPDPEAPLEP